MMTEGQYNKTVLENGIRVITESNGYVHSAAVGVFIATGARNENMDNHGAAHFLEHMVFKGTDSKDSFQIANSLESIGGMLNAVTGEEYTCYFARILDEHLEQAVDVLSDLVQNALLDGDVTDTEKGVIIEEIKGVADTPSQLVVERFISDMYPGHPLGMPILGTEKSIKNMKSDQLKEYRKTNYTPGNIIVAAAGNVNHDEFRSMVENYFPLKSSNSDDSYLPPDGVFNRGINRTKSPITQSHICLGFRAIAYDDDRRYAMLVLNTILSGGMSTRLFQNIREKYGFVYSVYSFPEFLYDTGYFCVYAGTDDSKTDKVIELIKNELNDLKSARVKMEEIQSARAQWKGGALISMESMMSRMNRIAIREMYFGDYSPIEDLIKKIDSVELDDVMSLSEDIFNEDDMVVTVMQPG